MVGDRIIPAHAGNTPESRGRARNGSDHPRACGEHPQTALAEKDWPGSSPRMRGTPSLQLCPFSGRRIIPAHAGNTLQ